MFAPPVLPLLLQMMSDATLARDVSEDSLRNFADLTRELLAWGVHTQSLDHTEAALRGAALLTPRAVRLDFSDLGRTLPADAENALFEVLSTQFADEARRGSFGTALDLAEGLGKRAWPIGRLQRLIFSACGSTDERTARHAIELAMSNPSTRDDIGHALLSKDPSTVVIPAVRRWIGNDRTDLLDRVLTGSSTGRFVDPDARHVPLFDSGFGRWTPRQQDLYATVLVEHAADETVPMPDRLAAALHLANLPRAHQHTAALTTHPDIEISRAALVSIGHSEEPAAALRLLANYLADDRLHAAIGSIRRCAQWIAPQHLYSKLRPVLASHSTEAVREGIHLAADLRVPQAIEVAQWAWEPSHEVGVRRAAVAVAYSLHREDDAWALLTAAAEDPDTVGALLESDPSALPPESRPRVADLVGSAATSDDPRLATAGLASLGRWGAWQSRDRLAVLVDALGNLERNDLWRHAVTGLVDGVARTADDDALIAATDTLLGSTAKETGDRDLPARQRLGTLCVTVIEAAAEHRLARQPLLSLADRLAKEPLWHWYAIDLYMVSVRWDDPEQAVHSFILAAELADGTGLVGYPAQAVSDRLNSGDAIAGAGVMLAIARSMSQAAGTAAGLISVELIGFGGDTFGWSDDWRELLQKARTHSDIDVQRAAMDVYMTRE